MQSKNMNALERLRRDIDPHSSDLHCVDVSKPGDVSWKTEPRTKCTATFPKRIVPKQKRVSNF